MVERRDVLKGLAAGALGAAFNPTLQGATPQAAQVDVVKTESFPSVDGKPLINKARAYEVLEQENLDGMIALNPVNVYYLTNTWSIGAHMRREVPGLATFPRDPKEPSFYVTSRSQLLDIANRRSEVPELMPYTGVANWRDYIGADQEQMNIEPEPSQRTYPVNKDAPLSTREQGWGIERAAQQVRAVAVREDDRERLAPRQAVVRVQNDIIVHLNAVTGQQLSQPRRLEGVEHHQEVAAAVEIGLQLGKFSVDRIACRSHDKQHRRIGRYLLEGQEV